MTRSNPLWRGALTLTVLATLAACGGGGGSGGDSQPDPPTNPPTNPPTDPPTSDSNTVGGTVTGLSGSGLVLQNNGGDDLTITGNGAFTFATAIANDSAYAVTALSQPTNPSQTCSVGNGSGTASANVTSVAVTCTTDAFDVRVTVSGLAGTGLILGNNADRASADSNATYTFSVASGARYNVVVEAAPNPIQRCTVANGSGVIGDADVDIAVTCVGTAPTYAYGLNEADGTLTSYLVNADTGQLRARFSAKAGDGPATVLTYKASNGNQFKYVLNTDSDDISAFAVNGRSGELDEVGSPFATADAPTLLVSNPKLPVIYATNEGGGSVTAFTINTSTGALTSLGSVSAGTTPRSFNIDASGRFAYVAAPGSSELFTYAIDQTTGALSEVADSRVAIGTSFGGVALERSGNYLYVFNPGQGSIDAFALDAATGVPTELDDSPLAAGTNIYLLGMHPNGRFIYAKRGPLNQSQANGVAVFALDAATGALSEIAGSPFDTAANPLQIAIDPTGKRLYASHLLASATPQYQVRAYSIDTTSGALSVIAGSPYAAPQFPNALTIDTTGKFLYTSNGPSDVLVAYNIDLATGSLSQLSSSPVSTGDQPGFIAVDQDATPLKVSSKFVYTTDSANTVHSFSVATDGTLTVGATTATGGEQGITLDPNGRYAYAVSPSTDAVQIYSVDSETGALTAAGSTLVTPASGPRYVTIEASGRYAYVSIPSAQQIVRYEIDASTGGLSSPTTTTLTGGEDVKQLLVTPNGRWLLAATASSTNLHLYRIDPSNGDLVDPQPIPVADPIDSLAVDSSGKYLYATSSTTGVLRSYQIYSPSGVPSAADSFSFAAGSTPRGVAADPAGELVFTADSTNGAVDMFQVDSSGALTHLDSAAITNPIAVTTDYSGKFAYVVTAAGQLHTLNVDRDAGTMTDNGATVMAGAVTEPGTIVTSSHTE